MTATALRGAAVWFRGDPFAMPAAEAVVHETDALVVLEEGRISAVGPAASLLPSMPSGALVESVGQGLMVPGFVDCHVHFVQLGIVGACGFPLLEWLERVTFPAEAAFADPAHAADVARRFLAELARHGTTTAAVFGSVHAGATEALFEAAEPSGLRIVAGKSWMDSRAPAPLRDTATSAYDDSRRLIERWHGSGRLGFAVTPRFVATSSPAQLEAAAALWREHPGVLLQSHLSENLDEIDLVRRQFPGCEDYVGVLDRFGLLGPGALYAHGIHLSERERARLAESGSALAHCPTSNLFLGSGLFDLQGMKHRRPPIPVGLATDVGAGTTLSMLRTMGAAYDVAQMRGFALAPSQALWLATQGSARAMALGDRVGNLAAGYDADVVVLDPQATELLAWRTSRADNLEALLGVLMTLGDDRAVRTVYAGGRRVKGET